MSDPEDQAFIDIQNMLAEPFVAALADAVVAQYQHAPPADPLRPPVDEKTAKKQLCDQVKQALFREKERERALQGMDLIFERLERGPYAGVALKELSAAAEHFLTLSQQETPPEEKEDVQGDPWEALLKEYVPLYQKLQISLETFKAMYGIGEEIFKEGAYLDAASVFEVLTQFDESSYSCWFSAGLCHYKLGNWAEAVANFTVAVLVNPAGLVAILNMGFCYLELHQIEKAKEMLSLAERLFASRDVEEEVKRRYRPKYQELKKKV